MEKRTPNVGLPVSPWTWAPTGPQARQPALGPVVSAPGPARPATRSAVRGPARRSGGAVIREPSRANPSRNRAIRGAASAALAKPRLRFSRSMYQAGLAGLAR